MQVVVKKSVLEQMLNQLVEERSFHSRRYDQIAGDDKPVLPDAQVASQLSASTVPLGDPDFLPVNKQQLSSAASQMAQQVSPDKIQKFYSGLKKLIRKTGEKKQYKGMSDTDLMEEVRLEIRRMLSEKSDDDESHPMYRDAVKAALQRAAQGGIDTVSSVQSRQDAAIRAAQGYAYEKKRPDSDDTPYTNVFDINRRPRLEPVELKDRVIGDVNRTLDGIKKVKMNPDDKKAKIDYPDSVFSARIEIRMEDKDEENVVVIINSPLLPKEVKSEYFKNEDGSPPFSIQTYKKIFTELFRQSASERSQQPYESPEVDITTDEDAEEFKELSQEQIFYRDLEELSKELGVPAGSLRNLGSDLAFIFGKRTGRASSPEELSGDRLNMYNVVGQHIYDAFIKLPGRKVANEVFKNLKANEKEAFKKALPKEEGAESLRFGDLVFEDDYTDFLESESTFKERITDIIDDCIKFYLKSPNFEKEFPELSGFKAGEEIFKSLKHVSKTEERLGIRDANSLMRFIAGFDLVKNELIGRCLDYLFAKVKGDVPDVTGIVESSQDELDDLLTFDAARNKYGFKEDIQTAIEAVSELSDILSYTEPTLDSLLISIEQSLKKAKGTLVKKRGELIKEIITAYVEAFR
jgi:hypothetical protein